MSTARTFSQISQPTVSTPDQGQADQDKKEVTGQKKDNKANKDKTDTKNIKYKQKSKGKSWGMWPCALLSPLGHMTLRFVVLHFSLKASPWIH